MLSILALSNVKDWVEALKAENEILVPEKLDIAFQEAGSQQSQNDLGRQEFCKPTQLPKGQTKRVSTVQ